MVPQQVIFLTTDNCPLTPECIQGDIVMCSIHLSICSSYSFHVMFLSVAQLLMIRAFWNLIWLYDVHMLDTFFSLHPLNVTRWPLMENIVQTVVQPLMIRAIWNEFDDKIINVQCEGFFFSVTLKSHSVTFAANVVQTAVQPILIRALWNWYGHIL